MVKSPTAAEPRSYLAQKAELPTVYMGGIKSDRRPSRLMGRKYKHLYAKMLKHIEEGASLRAAAGCIGVSYDTVKSWLRNAEGLSPNTSYQRFKRAVEKAQSTARAAAETHIKKRDPKAWLQANAPDMWHPERQTQIIVDNSKKVAFVEQTNTGDLAKTLAVLQQLGMAPAMPLEQDNNVIEAQEYGEKQDEQ